MSSALADYVVDKLFKLLSSIDKPKYPDTKPIGKDHDEYIVINCLKLPTGVFQTTYCNVNCHVKDTLDGWQNRAKLVALGQSVKSIIEKVTIIKGEDGKSFLLDLVDSDIIPERELKEHYYNLRFKVTIVNN